MKQTARIARLELSESELKRFSEDMKTILDSFESLNRAIVTKNVRPSFQPMETKNVTRDDRVEPSLSQKEALAQTEHKENGYFRGPRVA